MTFVVVNNLSLRQATSLHLRQLLIERDPVIEEVLPTAATTVAEWIKRYYPPCQQKVVSKLASAKSRITLSFDGWKSDSDMDLLGVIAHFIDDDFKHQTLLLSLEATHGSHTGENLSQALLAAVRSYSIGSNIGYFIADSATNNDKAIRYLQDDLAVDVKAQRLRCAAHIINLVCSAILLGADTDCIKDACSTNTSSNDALLDATDATIEQFEQDARSDQKALTAWRKKGPVGKLHNLVIHVKSSPARRNYFESKQKELDPVLPVYRLVTNGGIRWNSTYDMIKRALQLKDALELYQSHYRDDKDLPCAADELTNDDWLELNELLQLLAPMKETSTTIQANPVYRSHGAL